MLAKVVELLACMKIVASQLMETQTYTDNTAAFRGTVYSGSSSKIFDKSASVTYKGCCQ